MLSYHLEPGETVVRQINRSYFDLVPVVSSSVVIVFVCLAGLAVYFSVASQMPAAVAGMVLLVAVVLLSIVAMMLISGLYVYHHNFLVITNHHVIKVEQHGLFSQETAQLELSKVQDVTGTRHGVLGMVFNFGDIEIETAGAQENFIFRCVNDPQYLADQMLQYHEKFVDSVPGPVPAADES
jgi:membrane protein YdbS with pleckstrin-like domain